MLFALAFGLDLDSALALNFLFGVPLFPAGFFTPRFAGADSVLLAADSIAANGGWRV